MTAGQIDTSRPHPARVYDYLLGGKDHYPVDQALGEQMPEPAKVGVAQNRSFMHRAAAWAAREGIDQFLDIGTGIPTRPNLHQIVQEITPAARIVYTDNDPIVLRHAEALLVSTPEGVTDYLKADVRAPEKILDHARTVLDFERPVALSMIALMHFLADSDDPYGITRTLVDALPAGSCLALSHFTVDFLAAHQEALARYRSSGITLQPRSGAEVARFFDGLDLVAPGLVAAPHWHGTPAPEHGEIPDTIYAGVGRVRGRA
ncbi:MULTISPECIES: SAM-dependent methyltransferase [unclassified Streptomyces]|uniref:SAM-dependent methyltransferase n=1 Tax=unclassified Streptomyces TaxID=2593676 RepID=UPI000DACF279|nr:MULTISPECIES: SAM-dependent methyltransferase [unclassified Streptomyces]PZT73477.1 SAM-dependent methyltransferase [Streptomyces sp. AC1-42T]PZT83530.1 SAM-dependent methyltransferase [Streptomyces sp. AC1-42W]